MRGIAVLSVVIFHTAYFNPSSPVQNALLCITKSGWLGVPIFFILSGFLISYTVFKKGTNLRLGDYAARRIAKIGPPFLLSILIFGLAESLIFGKSGVIQSAIAHISTVAHFHSGWTVINPVYWSLMIEMHFYIVFPFVYFVSRRITKHPEIATFALFALLPAAFRIPHYLPQSEEISEWQLNANMFPKSMDNFALGILFSIFCLNRTRIRNLESISRILAPLGALILIACYASYSWLQWKFSPPGGYFGATSAVVFETYKILPSLGTFLLLFVIFLPSTSFISSALGFAPLQFLGVISYEWFLFHYPPVLILGRIFGPPDGNFGLYLMRTAVPFVMSLIFSFIVWRYFSDPILTWTKYKLKNQVRGARSITN